MWPTFVNFTFDRFEVTGVVNRMYNWTLKIFAEQPLGEPLKIAQTLGQILRRRSVVGLTSISAPSPVVSRIPIADSSLRSPAAAVVPADGAGAVSTGGWMSNVLRAAFYGAADGTRRQSAPVGRGNERETAHEREIEREKEREREREVVERVSVGVGSGLAIQDTLLRSDRVDMLCMVAAVLFHDPPTIGNSLAIRMLLADSLISCPLFLCILHCSLRYVSLLTSSNYDDMSSYCHTSADCVQLTITFHI